MGRRRRDIEGQFVSIGQGFLNGDDCRVVGFTNVELLAYLRLLGASVRYLSHLLPSRFNVNNPQVLARLLRVSVDVCQKAVRKASENELIRVTPEGRILVAGVADKHWWLTFKDDENGTEIDADTDIGKERICKISEDEKGREESGELVLTPTTSIPFNKSSKKSSENETEDGRTDFSEVYDVLSGIDAKGYRELKPYSAFDRDIGKEVQRLGRDRVVSEAEKMRSWVESRLGSGELEREKHLRPQDQFMRWLRRCKYGDDTKVTIHKNRGDRKTPDNPRRRTLEERYGT